MHRAGHALPDRRWLMSAYVFFFAFIAPLLCWGSMSDPAHPHAGAHFVFAEPTFAHVQVNDLLLHPHRQGVHHDHDPCLHPPGSHAVDAAAEYETTQAATRAVPATLLAQLLICIAWGPLGWSVELLPFVMRYRSSPWPTTHQVSVPTPPPRLLSIPLL